MKRDECYNLFKEERVKSLEQQNSDVYLFPLYMSPLNATNPIFCIFVLRRRGKMVEMVNMFLSS